MKASLADEKEIVAIPSKVFHELQNLEKAYPFFSFWGKRDLFTKDKEEKQNQQ